MRCAACDRDLPSTGTIFKCPHCGKPVMDSAGGANVRRNVAGKPCAGSARRRFWTRMIAIDLLILLVVAVFLAYRFWWRQG